MFSKIERLPQLSIRYFGLLFTGSVNIDRRIPASSSQSTHRIMFKAKVLVLGPCEVRQTFISPYLE